MTAIIADTTDPYGEHLPTVVVLHLGHRHVVLRSYRRNKGLGHLPLALQAAAGWQTEAQAAHPNMHFAPQQKIPKKRQPPPARGHPRLRAPLSDGDCLQAQYVPGIIKSLERGGFPVGFVALPAIHRTALPWLKRHFGGRTACRTHRRIKSSRLVGTIATTTATSPTARSSASRTSRGVV